MQAQQQRATADRILLAASRLFAEKGFSNVSVRELCRDAGTTAPVIYYYFGSKRGLFEAVARSKVSMADFIARLSKVAEGKDPQADLREFIQAYLGSFPEHAFDPGLYMRDSATLDRKSARMISEDLDTISSIASGLVARCVRGGKFRDADVELASDCLLGMLNKVIFQHAHFAKASDRSAYGEFVTDFFFRAMK